MPITALKAAGAVEFTGGRGLVAIADIDVLLANLLVAAAVVHVFRSRHMLKSRAAYLTFCVVLAAVSAILLAYVVTNFGTLFRLRVMAFVPLWLLPLALVPDPGDGAERPHASH